MSENEPMTNHKDADTFYRNQKIYYLINKVPFTLMPGIFNIVYVYFFWDYLGLEQFLFVIGMVIYGIFNALNDPLLGQWSDRVDVNKWGSRRLIFIKYGGPIWALLFFLIWVPWSYDNQIIIFLHFIIMMVLYDNMLTMVILVWDALLPEIAESIDDRNKIFFLGGVVGAIGGIPILFTLTIKNAGLIAFQLFSGILAVISAIIFVLAGIKLHERPELHQEMNLSGWFKSFKQCIRSRSFVSFTLYRFFRVINETMTFSFMFVYALLFTTGFDTILLITFGLGGVIGQLVYVRLSEKKVMQSLIMHGRAIEISIAMVAFLISLLKGTEFIWFGLLIIKIILGGYSVFVNPYLLLVCDEDEMKYNTRREGMYLGTNAIFNKIAESTGPILAVTVLILFGFRQNAPEGYIQSESAIIGIKFLLFIVPSIMDALGMIALKFYQIKGDYLKELKKYIEKAHQDKLIEYKETKKRNINVRGKH
ncbi:MAG: MFS transporter [Candidatus Hodarchaeota archaeon]